MIFAALLKGWNILKLIPREVWYFLAAAALAWFVDHRAYQRGYGDSEAEHAELARKAAERARVADSAANDTVTRTTDEVEKGNDDARKAAEGSDDPLRAGLDRLRRD